MPDQATKRRVTQQHLDALSQERHIGPMPPQDGNEWDCQCARCGSSADSETCTNCGGEGLDGHECGEDCCMCLDKSDNVTCDICDGFGHWYRCLSSPEWCEENPLPGRESVERGKIEWFRVRAFAG